MRKIGVRVLNALLLAFCCFEAAQIVTRVTAQNLDGAAPTAEGDAVVDSPSPAGQDDVDPIVQRNLFGALVGDAVVLAPSTEEPVEETKLPLTLLATIAPDPRSRDESQVARAAIYDAGTRESLVVVPGDVVGSHPDVVVYRIEPKRVLLRNQGRNEELLLADEASLASDGRPSPPPLPSVTRRPTRGRPTPPVRSVRPRSFNRAANRPAPPVPAARPEIDPEDARRLEELRQKVSRGEMSVDDLASQVQDMIQPDPGEGDPDTPGDSPPDDEPN